MSSERLWELFNCQKCGICCTGIELPFDPESFFAIAEFFGLTVKQAMEKYYGQFTKDGKSWESSEHKRKPCPFFMTGDEGKSLCKIYPVRPKGCKLYPFESSGGLDCPVARNVYAKLREEQSLGEIEE